MSVRVDVEELEHNMAKLTVTADPEDFDKAITYAYKKVKNQLSVPGFRRGKVPQAMIEKMYGPEMFYEDAANYLVPQAYDDAVGQLKDIIITSQPEITLEQIAKGKDFIFTAKVATKPEAQLGQYTEIEVEEEPIEVTDEEVDQKIEAEQKKNARQVKVDRPAQEGDTVVIDYVGTVDGEEFVGGSAENYSLELGSKTFIPGFEDQLVGVSAGDEKEVNVKFPEDYNAKDLAGQDAVVKVTVHEVQEKQLPEINDEFAQEVSEFDTLDEYKADVEKTIRDQKEKAALSARQQAVVDKIVENAEIDIPEPMVDTQARQMIDGYARQLQYSGLSLQQYYQFSGLTEDDLLEQMKPQALKNIQSRLVLEAVAKAENLEATEEETTAEIQKMADQYNMELEKVRDMLTETEIDMINSDISSNKALDFVTNRAVVVPKKPEEEPAADAQEADAQEAADAPAEDKTEE